MFDHNQKSYGAVVRRFSRALETALPRLMSPGLVPVFTDAQAATRPMASEETGSSHTYALHARKPIALLPSATPAVTIGIPWTRAHGE